MRYTMEYLIKSGGGNGPVKPGNLCSAQGAKSGGETKDEANRLQRIRPGIPGVFVLLLR